MNPAVRREKLVKVLFIVGSGRSGSTLLDVLVGQLHGFFSTGELHSLWQAGLVERRLCGCGSPVPECATWMSVLREVGLEGTAGEGEAIEALRARSAARRRLASADPAARTAYAEIIAGLYRAVARTSSARVIVGSSKDAAASALLRDLKEVDAYFVHLIRDPRAVAFSWARRKVASDRAGQPLMERFSARSVARAWRRENRAAMHLGRGAAPFLTVRYEDLVARPAEALERICRLVGEEPDHAGFLHQRFARLGENHTVSGNPIRLSKGPVMLREDRQWVAAQRIVDRWVVTAFTYPLLRRFGYDVFAKGIPRAAPRPATTFAATTRYERAEP